MGPSEGSGNNSGKCVLNKEVASNGNKFVPHASGTSEEYVSNGEPVTPSENCVPKKEAKSNGENCVPNKEAKSIREKCVPNGESVIPSENDFPPCNTGPISV